MLTALDSSGRPVIAFQLSRSKLNEMKKMNFTCPDCSKKVILKAGSYVIPHFAHYVSHPCSFQKGESAEHQKGKIDLYEWCTRQGFDTRLEYRLAEVDQRIDVVTRYGHNTYAIEYQCSPLSTKELHDRTVGIVQSGLEPLWIFGIAHFKRMSGNAIRLTPLLKSAIIYGETSKLVFYSSKDENLIICSDLSVSASLCFCSITSIKLNQLKSISQPKRSKSYLLHNWLAEKRRFRTKQTTAFSSKEDQAYIKYLYKRYLHPQYLPACIHLPVAGTERLLIPNYIWQTRFVLDFWMKKEVGSSFTWQELHQALYPLFLKTVHSNNPSWTVHPLYAYINLLSKLGYFQRDEHQYTILKRPKYPKTLDEAMMFDKNILTYMSSVVCKSQ